MEFKTYRFDEVTTNFDKKRVPVSGSQREKRRGTYRYFGAQGVIDYIDDYIFDGTYLLIAEDGDNLKSKKQNIAQIATGQFWVNNHAHIVQGNDLCDTRFLCYLLNSMDLSGYVTGSAQPKLSQANLNAVTITIPDIAVQRKIVEYLYAFDQKIETNQRINDNLEQQISSIYENLCENKSWDSCELGSLIEVKDGTHDSPKPQSDGYLLVTSKHLLPYGVDRTTPNRIAEKDFTKINERSLVEPGDVLMSMIGTIGLISFVADQNIDYAIKNVALFKTSKTPELAYYFLTFLKSKKTQQYIEICLAGSTQKYISLGELRKMPIPDPDGETLKCFNEIVRPMYQAIILNTQENNSFAALRDSLLPKLISGELDISEIDI